MEKTKIKDQETSQPYFDIQQVYVKEQSCKPPSHVPAIFQDEWKPDIQLERTLNLAPDTLPCSSAARSFHLDLINN